jgi:hypothetical protein
MTTVWRLMSTSGLGRLAIDLLVSDDGPMDKCFKRHDTLQ